MSDLKRYIAKRKTIDEKFARDYDQGYSDLKTNIRIHDLSEKPEITYEKFIDILKI